MSQSGRDQRRRKDLIKYLQSRTDLSADQQTLLVADKTIEQLRAGAPRCARAFELEVFQRMSPRKIARTLNRSEDTINRDLRFARAALNRNLLDGGSLATEE